MDKFFYPAFDDHTPIGDDEAHAPTQKKLPHDVPPWVPEGSVFFITICCQKRAVNTLATPKMARIVRESLQHRQATLTQWWIHLFLIMPDHVHGLISFARAYSMKKTVADWKRYLARHHAIDWQADFFDHRIRNDDELSEKWSYIVNNPVRAGAVDTAGDWPYSWTADDLANR